MQYVDKNRKEYGNISMQKIDNNCLLVENGSLAMKYELRCKQDFEVISTYEIIFLLTL